MKINPIIKRTFKIMSRAGRLPKPPEELLRLKNPLLRIDLDGPLAQSIKSFSTQNGLQAAWEWVRELKNFGFESELDNLDMDDFVRKAVIAVGAPATTIRELKTRDEIRQQKQAMIEQQMQMQQLQQASEIERNMNGQGNLNNAQGMN
jgi:Xaa-Pro aminopeptidase